ALDRNDVRRWPLLRREQELFGLHGKDWVLQDGFTALGIDPIYAGELMWTGYHRGLMEFAWFASPDVYLRAAELLNHQTPLRRIKLHSPYTFSGQQEVRARGTYFRIYSESRGYLSEEDANADPTFPEPEEFRNFAHSAWACRLRSFQMNALYVVRQHLE